jgi:hypothetical protein
MPNRRAGPILALAAVAAAWIGTELVVPSLIRSAHAGRGPAVLERRLEGRDRHPAEHYLEVWRRNARPAAAAATAVALLAAAMSWPPTRRRLANWLGRAVSDTAEPVPPTAGRRRLVASVAFVFLAGSAIELVIDPPYRGEHWPFSQYRMYSEMPRRTPLTGRRLFGVTDDTPEREIPLAASRYIRPFDSSRLWVAWDRLDTSPHRERLLQVALADTLRRYESLRRRGEHSGPHLRAARLYRLTWDVDDRASKRDAPRRELLFEVRASDPPLPSP